MFTGECGGKNQVSRLHVPKYKKGYYTKCLKTKYWFARIAAKNSLSPQVNRNSMQKRVLTTHPLAAKRAEGTASPQPAASPAA